MADGIDATMNDNIPLGESEFRLKLRFKPSAGPAVRVFKFYKEWLEATNTIVNEFASHICKGLRVEIKLVEIKEGSADPKFIFEPSLIGATGQIAIPEDLLRDFIPHLHEVVNADIDFLMENVDTNNFEEFFVGKLAELETLRNDFAALKAKTEPLEALSSIPVVPTPSLSDETQPMPEISEKPRKEPALPKYNRKKVFSALNQIAQSTSLNLLNGEMVTQLSPDGESIDFTPELVRSSSALQDDEEIVTETTYENQSIVASRAVMIGDGIWSFLWGGKSKRMQIEDDDWLERFHRGEVALVAKQALAVDIKEIETKYLKMGIVYKKKYKFTVDKIYE